LIGQAEQEVDREEVKEVKEVKEEEEEEIDEETISKMEEAMEEGVEEEEGQHLAERPKPIKPKKLSYIQKAYLEFCVTLLN
jgi:ssDNA-binding replication factor A large subunit